MTLVQDRVLRNVRGATSGNEKAEVAIVIKVCNGCPKVCIGILKRRTLKHFGKCAVLMVQIENICLLPRADKNVKVAIVVEVTPGGTRKGRGLIIDDVAGRDFGEGSLALGMRHRY